MADQDQGRRRSIGGSYASAVGVVRGGGCTLGHTPVRRRLTVGWRDSARPTRESFSLRRNADTGVAPVKVGRKTRRFGGGLRY